jgi:hypothetical protein
MKNETETTLTLTDADHAFYEAFQKQVENFGLANAFEDRADRNRYRAIDKVLKTEYVAPTKATATGGKKRIEDKLHYRYMVKDIEFLNRFAEVDEDEVPAWVIMREEQVRALDKFQPVLGRQDTSRRMKFKSLEEQLLVLAAEYGRVVDFNWAGLHAGLRDEFGEKYNETWAVDGHGIAGLTVFPVLDGDMAEAFRNYVRPRVEAATVEIFRTAKVAA